MMMQTKPSALLIRSTRMINGEPAGSITMDTSADNRRQRELRQNVRNIAEAMADLYHARLPADAEIEILTGRTANKIERIEDLLNDARNLLIDLAADEPEDGKTRAQIERMLDDMTTELGYD
jgi:hypothetical protein